MDEDPRPEQSNGIKFHCVHGVHTCICVYIHRQGSHFYKHPPRSNASQNPQLLGKSDEKGHWKYSKK